VSEVAPPRPRGRPRSAEAHGAILGAAAALLAEGGFAQLTMEAVASRAGVSKATVYRRWKSKEDLVLELVSAMPYGGEPPDTGSVEGDLVELTQIQIDRIADTPLPRMMPRLLAETFDAPDLHDAIVENAVDVLRGTIAAILRHGIERGELRSDFDVELAVDALHGSIVYRILLGGGDLRQVVGYGPRMYRLLLQGLRP
jgi:AcrR family transcriptional regulator